jgi:hypothetical protein
LLLAAIGASPTYAPARLALARLDESAGEQGNGSAVRGLALSRDPIALAWTARRLLKAGRKDVAFPLFRQALSLATRPELSKDLIPEFSDDPQAPRYLLPGEDLVREILSVLASDRSLDFGEWSTLLEGEPVAQLVAARLLRDRSRRDSEAALSMILDEKVRSAVDDPRVAINLAARAEAFTMRANWKEAERDYQAAIERIDHETTSRSWWFNLARIETRLKDETKSQIAIKQAIAATAASDDISRRATELRRGRQTPTAQFPRVRGVGLKAN